MPPGIASGIRGKRKSAARRFFPTPSWSLPFASFWMKPCSAARAIARSGPGFGIRASGPRRTEYCICCAKTSCSRRPGSQSRFGAIRTKGQLSPNCPNQMWGTDATTTFTGTEGTVTVFAAIDHCTAECVGIHVVKKATRFEALEPIRQGMKEQFGAFSGGIAAGLRLRHDHGSVYMSDDFQNEIRFLAIEPSPAFVRQPEGNGCIERFFRTLKEQLLWIRHFRDLEELRAALIEFRT